MKPGMPRNKYLIPAVYIHTFFIVGILSSLAIRLILLFKHINPDYIRPAWYTGIIGYVIFFAYRYYISNKRKSLIRDHALLEKVQNMQEMEESDKELLEYIVSSIMKSNEHINYMFIFVSSILVIGVDLAIAFFW